MRYKNTIEGTFIDRPNRFIAHVLIEGVEETVHVKNTGRCKELLIPGVKVILEISDNPSRKTKYDLICVWKEKLGWVNIDSQAPNKLVYEWLCRRPAPFENITAIKPEHKFGDSRIDFYMEEGEKKILMEVKGCTLEINGEGFFPDAPTERGIKHLRELGAAVKKGYECYIAFAITMEKVSVVHPNLKTHPEFGVALEEAMKDGVKVLFLECGVDRDEVIVTGSNLRIG